MTEPKESTSADMTYWQKIATAPRYGWVAPVNLRVRHANGTYYRVLDATYARGLWWVVTACGRTRAFPPEHTATHWKST